MLHLVVHLVGRRSHDQIADGVASHRNVRIGAKNVNAVNEYDALDQRLISQHDSATRCVLDGILGLSHLIITPL